MVLQRKLKPKHPFQTLAAISVVVRWLELDMKGGLQWENPLWCQY